MVPLVQVALFSSLVFPLWWMPPRYGIGYTVLTSNLPTVTSRSLRLVRARIVDVGVVYDGVFVFFLFR